MKVPTTMPIVMALASTVTAIGLLFARHSAENRLTARTANMEEVSRQLAGVRRDLEETRKDSALLRAEAEAKGKALAKVTAEKEATNQALVQALADLRSREEAASLRQQVWESSADAAAIREGKACKSITQALWRFNPNLEDPKILDPEALRWLLDEGGWHIEDVRDLGKALEVVGQELEKLHALEEAGVRQSIIDDHRETYRADTEGLRRVMGRFTSAESKEALKALRSWRPRKD